MQENQGGVWLAARWSASVGRPIGMVNHTLYASLQLPSDRLFCLKALPSVLHIICLVQECQHVLGQRTLLDEKTEEANKWERNNNEELKGSTGWARQRACLNRDCINIEKPRPNYAFHLHVFAPFSARLPPKVPDCL